MKLRRNPIWRPGKKRPATFAFLDPGPPLRKFHQRIIAKNKPSAIHSHSQRVRQPILRSQLRRSALDLRAGRDLDTKELKVSCFARWEQTDSCSQINQLAGGQQSE